MKQVVRIGVLCAAVAALALGSTAIAGAGGKFPVQGDLVVTPTEVVPGGTVTISNAPDEDSTCEPPDGPSNVSVVIYNDIYEIEMQATPDDDGNWSADFVIPNEQNALGEWEVDAFCDDLVPNAASPLAFPEFLYPLTNFDVVAPVDPIVPDSGTEPAEEVRTAPRFTG